MVAVAPLVGVGVRVGVAVLVAPVVGAMILGGGRAMIIDGRFGRLVTAIAMFVERRLGCGRRRKV